MKGLSPRAQRLMIALAQDEARKLGSEQLLPEHILLAMLKSGDGLGYLSLQMMHINVLTLQLALEQSLPVHSPKTDFADLPLSRRVRTMLDVAAVESRALHADYIGTEHILLAAIRDEQSITWRYFSKAEISMDMARNVVADVERKVPSSAKTAGMKAAADALFNNPLTPNSVPQFSDGSSAQKKKNDGQSILAHYSRDLTAIAREGTMDPVIGREKEILRVIQILCRRTKNNPVLVGEPGVGKTAIVEGLALHIVNGNVPHDLLKKRVLSLDLAAMIAGTKYRGEFEERMKRLMKEVQETNDVILFIDELHTIIGAGGPEGSMDASNMLKPALSRGELQCIGATTTKEYRKYFEKDSALVRRFQTVRVEEPDENDTKLILEGLKKKYEEFHSVKYDDNVIEAIVKYSRRYIPERCLPDKAIDIMDEAGSAKKIHEEERPAELAELEESIERLTEEKKTLVADQDYEKAAIVRDKVVDLKAKLESFSSWWTGGKDGDRKKVTVDDICAIISLMTGIPVEQLDDGETQRLLNMEKELHKEVIGQEEAVKLISSAVRRSRAGVSSTKRPLGSFIFLGPTGVGKTQLAKTLAKFLFGTEDSLVRIDMSDYMEKQNASRLVGAPPGYVGFDEGGVLTEKIRQHPYSVVLLDEIEKAHPDVFNLLLQLLEEGELSDNLGHTVSFRNTVIIMTSNAGAREITAESRVGFSTVKEGLLPYSEIKAGAMEELKKIMSPELLNRIDDVVVFNALSREEVDKILTLQIKELSDRIAEKGIKIELTSKARNFMVENGYEPSMGARPMRRLIQKDIEDQLANLLLMAPKDKTDTVVIDCRSEELIVSYKKLKSASEKSKSEKKKAPRRTKSKKLVETME